MRIGKPAEEPKAFVLDDLSRIRLEMASRIAAGLAHDGAVVWSADRGFA